MGIGISGNYDGEGPNVAPASPGVAPGPVVKAPDVWAKRGALNNGITGGQGINGLTPVDRVGRLRTAEESARSGAAIAIGGGDQVLSVCARYVYVSTGGTLVCRLADDTADITLAGLVAGSMLPLQVGTVRSAGTTIAGVLLF